MFIVNTFLRRISVPSLSYTARLPLFLSLSFFPIRALNLTPLSLSSCHFDQNHDQTTTPRCETPSDVGTRRTRLEVVARALTLSFLSSSALRVLDVRRYIPQLETQHICLLIYRQRSLSASLLLFARMPLTRVMKLVKAVPVQATASVCYVTCAMLLTVSKSVAHGVQARSKSCKSC